MIKGSSSISNICARGPIWILSLVLFISCDNSSGPSADIENNVNITVLDSAGADLLNPENSNSIDTSRIKVYYEVDGVKTEINNANMDNPRMFSILEPSPVSENYRLSLLMDIPDGSEISTTYLEWWPERTDVFRSSVDRVEGGGITNDKTWFNGELICDREVDSGICGLTVELEP